MSRVRYHRVNDCSPPPAAAAPGFTESLFAFVPEYHVDAMLELCNTLRLYMHPTVPVHQLPGFDAPLYCTIASAIVVGGLF